MKITLIVSSFLFSFPIPFFSRSKDICWQSLAFKTCRKKSTKPRYKWNPRECHLNNTLSKPFNIPGMKQTAMKRVNSLGNLVELDTVPSFSADNTTRVAWNFFVEDEMRLKPLELSTWANSSSPDWRVLDSRWIPEARSDLQNNLKELSWE